MKVFLSVAVFTALLFALCSSQTVTLGPSPSQVTGLVTFNDGKCKVCQIDCQYGNMLTCQTRYYNYGCHIQNYCIDISSLSPRDFDAAIAFCFAYNGCTWNEAAMKNVEVNGVTMMQMQPKSFYSVANPSGKRVIKSIDDVRNSPLFSTLAGDTRTYYGVVSQLADFKRRVRSCKQGIFGNDYQTYYPSWTESNIVRDFQTRLQYAVYNPSETDSIKQEIRDKFNSDCYFAMTMEYTYLEKIKEAVSTSFNKGIVAVDMNEVETVVKRFFFGRAHLPRSFFFYFKVVADVADNYNKFMTDANYRSQYVQKFNDGIKKIPDFVGESGLGISGEEGDFDTYTLSPKSEITAEQQYQPITEAHILNLKYQKEQEGEFRMMKIASFALGFQSDFTSNQLKDLQRRYGDTWLQNQPLDSIIDKNSLKSYLSAYFNFMNTVSPLHVKRFGLNYDEKAPQITGNAFNVKDLLSFYFGDKLSNVVKVTAYTSKKIEFSYPPEIDGMVKTALAIYKQWGHGTYASVMVAARSTTSADGKTVTLTIQASDQQYYLQGKYIDTEVVKSLFKESGLEAQVTTVWDGQAPQQQQQQQQDDYCWGGIC